MRFWAYQDLTTNKFTHKRDWTALDRVFAAAAANHQRLLVTLTDQWANCKGEVQKTPNWYASGHGKVEQGDLQSFDNYMVSVVSRYRNSPALGMWELVNEPEAGPNGATVLRSFFDTVGGKLKSIDSKHLLEMGVIGSNQLSIAGSDYVTVAASPAIDVLSYHDYNADNQTMPASLSLRLSQMRTLNKPLIIGESGIQECSGQDRTNKFKAKMSAAFAAGASGYMPWNYVPTGTGCSYDIVPTDKIMSALRRTPPDADDSASRDEYQQALLAWQRLNVQPALTDEDVDLILADPNFALRAIRDEFAFQSAAERVFREVDIYKARETGDVLIGTGDMERLARSGDRSVLNTVVFYLQYAETARALGGDMFEVDDDLGRQLALVHPPKLERTDEWWLEGQ